MFFKLEVTYVNMKKSTDSDNGNNLGSMGQWSLTGQVTHNTHKSQPQTAQTREKLSRF